MAIGIAVRDDRGITHWAPFREGRPVESAKMIAHEFNKGGKPALILACARSASLPIYQVRRVSTLMRSVTCMACMTRI